MSRVKFAILGGDYRYKILYEMLIDEGYQVDAYGNEDNLKCVTDIKELIKDKEVLIAPIPCTKNGKTVFMKNGEEIDFENIFKEMYKQDSKYFIGGVVPKEIKMLSAKYNLKCYDFFEQESVAVLNAIPTAEGAIQTAMQESESTVFGSNALVLGYGRCGKILSNMLKGIGANVTVSFRSEKDEAYINAFGLKSVRLSNLECVIGGFDFIFNTIPSQILDKQILKSVNRRSIIIDLAQAPGGVDYNFARDTNLKALYCPGLPGRVAPYKAAEILKSAILNICLK